MAVTKQDRYLESKVLTAPSHQLQLMLIEGAIRYGRQAEAALRRGDRPAASAPLVRVIDIVGEMLAGVRGSTTALNKKVADFYLFLFRTVAEAKVNDSVEKLAEALQLLEFERETWQLVCDKLGATEARRPVVPPFGDDLPPSTSVGLSLEA